MKKPLYTIHSRETFVCPICHWRVTDGKEAKARTLLRWHMKYEHKVSGKEVKLV